MSEEALAGRSVAQTPSRARLAALLVLVALLPLLALAWVAATGVGRSETSKADLRLELGGTVGLCGVRSLGRGGLDSRAGIARRFRGGPTALVAAGNREALCVA